MKTEASTPCRTYTSLGSLLTILCMVGVLAPAAFGYNTAPLITKHIGTREGLSQNTVLDMHQDSQGFVWIATENGLNRYDGYSVSRFYRSSESGITDDFIYSITEDAQADMWFGSARGGLIRWHRQTDHFEAVSIRTAAGTGANRANVRVVLAAGDGSIWIGTRGRGLIQLNPATGEQSQFQHSPQDPVSLPSDHVNALFEDRHGVLWVGTNAGLAKLLPDGRSFRSVRSIRNGTELTPMTVRAIHEDSQGVLWIGTANQGAVAYFPGNGQMVAHRPESTGTGTFCSSSVADITQGQDQRLWFATDQGLCVLKSTKNEFELIGSQPAGMSPTSTSDPQQGLTNHDLLSLMIDVSGQLWIGTRHQGINIWNPQSQLFGHKLPKPDLASITAFESHSTGLWVGTMGDGLFRIDQQLNTTEFIDRSTGLPDDRIMALENGSDNRLWVGTMGQGLLQLSAEGDILHHWHTTAAAPLHIPSDAIMSLLQDSRGRLWVGTYGQGIVRLNEAGTVDLHLNAENVDSGLNGDQAMTIAEDAFGAIWVGTEAGLFRFDENTHRLETIYRGSTATEQSTADAVYALHSDNSGNLWIGTAGAGLQRVIFNDHGFELEAHPSVIELGAAVIYGIQSDLQGNLWLSGNRGLVRYTPQSNTVRRFRASQGLQGDEFNFGAHHRTAQGELVFGGAHGFNWFNPSDLNTSDLEPRVAITAVEVQGKPVTDRFAPSLRQLTLTYTQKLINFEFAAMDFVDPLANLFEYRMVGHDPQWVNAGTSRRASYSGLPHGNYEFQVRAASSSGVWSSAPATLRIKVEPPPWLTIEAYAVYATLTLMILAAIWRLMRRRRARAIKRREELHQLAYFDTLTGLPNRNYLIEHGEPLLLHGKQSDSIVGVLYIDCDHFKRVNDTLGHEKADQVLQVLADRARRITGQLHTAEAIVSRISGDEFCVAASDFQSRAEIDLFAQHLQVALSEPVAVAHTMARVTSSIGIAAFPADGTNMDELIKHADLAMRTCKTSGRNTLAAFDSSMASEAVVDLQLEVELLKAMQEDQLELYFQPRIDTLTGKTIGAEALTRWNHPQRGMIMPGHFIPMAERTGLIANMDSWVMRSIFQQLERWQGTEFASLTTSFNVSSIQFSRPDFASQLRYLSERHHIDPMQLEIEITEGILMQDPDVARDTLTTIRNMGIRIAIDDFGTGYSSLSYLKNFPIDVLKIDRSFVMDVDKDQNNQSLCRAIIALSKSLHMEVVAEGIESREQFEFLKQEGCDQIQGFWASRPIPLAAFERYVAEDGGMIASDARQDRAS